MKNIYGNNLLKKNLFSMVSCDKAAHAVLFYGQPGTGRKLMARYYTELLLCENPSGGKPCGLCNACRNIEKDIHPDVVYAQTSGKLGGYSIDTARKICADAFIKPNNSSGRKIYIFRDCRKIEPRTQNALLKIIEEPPDYAYFIFTAESKSDFLPTIISRCICFAVSPCTEEETRAALSEEGFSAGDINEAVSCFHGNIGQCIEYLSGSALKEAVRLTKGIAESIIRKDEYALNLNLFSAGRDRDNIKNLLSLADELMRDTAALQKDRNLRITGCCRSQALRLSEILTPYQAVKIHGFIEKAWRSVGCNVSAQLVMAALSCEIMSELRC